MVRVEARRRHLIGRTDIVALIERRLRAASDDGPAVLALVGEAGIGKTRLLEEAEERARLAGYDVLRGVAYPSDLGGVAGPLLDLALGASRSDTHATLGRDLLDTLTTTGSTTTDPARQRLAARQCGRGSSPGGGR